MSGRLFLKTLVWCFDMSMIQICGGTVRAGGYSDVTVTHTHTHTHTHTVKHS